MLALRAGLAFIFAIALVFVETSPAFARLPVEAFTAQRTVGAVEISPNGRYAAMPLTKDGQHSVIIVDLDAPAGTPNTAIPMGTEIDVDWVGWKGDNRLLIGLTKGREDLNADNFSRVIAVDRDGKNMKPLFSSIRKVAGNRNLSRILDWLPNDPNSVVMAAWDNENRYNVYRLDVTTGTATMLQNGITYYTFNWMTDRTGTPRIRMDYKFERGKVEYYARIGDTSNWTMISQFNALDFSDLEISGFTNDPNIAIVISNQKGDRFGLYEYNLTTKTYGRVIFEHPRIDAGHNIDEDIGGPIYDEADGSLVGIYYIDDLWQSQFFDAKLQGIQNQLDATFPDAARIEILSWSKDRRRFAVRTNSSSDPGTYYVFDAQNNSMRRIGKRFPEQTPAELGVQSAIRFKSRDGTTIPGYLTMPAGKGSKNLPLIVMPHGGPKTRDTMNYHPWIGLMNNRGYAVLQVNFRGSAGYGKAFMQAGYGQWGRRMQDDVTDGVKALIADGTADANRICIVGGSYGGYAALAGGALTPELYKCVVSVNGVSDLIEMMDHESRLGTSSGIYQYWAEQIGDPSRNRENLIAVSPARNADKFRAPVLLVVGTNDQVVPPVQSSRMEKALKDAGKPVQTLTIAGEGHSFATRKSRATFYKELEAFLAQHLGQ